MEMAQVEEGDSAARERWLRERRTGIGGTDAAAILGLSPYASQYDVWLEKHGRAVPIQDNPRMLWGRLLEPIVAQRYEVETGRKLWDPGSEVYRNKDHDILIGTPDRVVIDHPGGMGLDIKTAGVDQAHLWGEAGTDDIPSQYVIQCCHYMMVTEFNAWEVAVLIGGNDFRVYRLRRDRDLEASMRERLVAWWKRHMVEGEEPPMGASQGVREFLKRRFPRDLYPMVKADAGANAAAARLASARDLIGVYEIEKATAENTLKAMIGDNAGMEGDGWRVSWRATKGRRVRDLNAFTERAVMLVAQMLTGDEAGNIDVAREMVNAELDKATVEVEGSRRFLFTQKGTK